MLVSFVLDAVVSLPGFIPKIPSALRLAPTLVAVDCEVPSDVAISHRTFPTNQPATADKKSYEFAPPSTGYSTPPASIHLLAMQLHVLHLKERKTACTCKHVLCVGIQFPTGRHGTPQDVVSGHRISKISHSETSKTKDMAVTAIA
eukprot:scaffold34693_cov256-Amphora_coffeaeformis.AAC.1